MNDFALAIQNAVVEQVADYRQDVGLAGAEELNTGGRFGNAGGFWYVAPRVLDFPMQEFSFFGGATAARLERMETPTIIYGDSCNE